jgi:gliding motility-associated-like protein
MFCQISFSQNIQISGIPNFYLRVDEVQTDRVRVTDVAGSQIGQFQSENKVLLIQMTGGTLLTPLNFKTLESRTKNSFNHTGTFEVLQVEKVTMISATEAWIIFTDDISRTYDAGEKIQLVKFAEGETVSTTGLISAMDWNGTVGGIVAIIGTDSIKLNHNIDVSAQGYRGGAIPDENYTGGCRYGLSTSIKDTLYFLPTELNRSGNKGEGLITTAWPYTKGTAFALNGGGAGNGMYSGGGGGSNYNVGGDGGRQSPVCSGAYPALGGWGGYGCFDMYTTSNRQIIMGGGGGSGAKLSTSTPSKGGDGGGIVMIITGVLVGNGKSIVSNGENATATTGSGGGGGAGGTVIIDATSFSGALTVNVKGGKGGNTTDAANCTGSGGGGSGGVVWHNGTSFSPTVDYTYGAFGSVAGSCSLVLGIPGTPGSTGAKVNNLITPLTGFLFNSLHGTDTICAGQTPKQLTASQPKGGDGTYLFYWEKSTDNVNWTDASGTNLKTFQPPALSQTTWYRRIVTSNSVFDTSRVVWVYVHPAIGNNTIYGIDTICYNSQAKLIPGSQPTGGNNTSYTYQWQERDSQSTWSNMGSALTANTPLDPGKLTSTMYYRRLVSSTKYCRDTSNTDKITVLPLISNNGFATADTSICINQSPGQLNALPPAGGDGVFSYAWQYKPQAGNWTNLPASNVLRYTVGVLTSETLYRRIVYSGNDQACIDTGSVKTIHTMPLITNNRILGDSVQYTCYNTPVALPGSQPQNGFSTYAYQWEQSSDNVSWNLVTGVDRDYESTSLISKQYFRRVVYSSPEYHECSDISDAVEIRINPLPAGDVITANDTLCAGETLYVKFNLSGNRPFNVVVAGEDVPNQSKTGISALMDSVAFTPATTQQFTMYSVEDDSGCFAAVSGFTNITHGIVYAVPVANAGADEEACGATYTLKAVKSTPGSVGLWTGTNVIFSDSSNAASNVTAGNFETKTLTWTETNWHCTDADDVEITFHEQPQTPDAGPDQTLDFSYTTQLQAAEPTVGTGKWTVESGKGIFDDDALPNAVVSELTSTNTLKWTVTNGNCPAVSDMIEILINPLVIVKGFTPNGDTKNDVFDIGAANAERIRIKVFNSAGVLVFESDNYQEGDLWDGTNMNSVELPEGTYYYLIDMKIAGKQEEVQFRSFVEILR